MKYKKLLFSTLLSLGCLVTYITMTSNSGGVMNNHTTGCGGASCHGSQSSATLITVSGIPASGYVANTTYAVTLTLTNPSMSAAGFDLNFSGGNIPSAPSGTMPMGTELHHTSKKTMTSGTVSWNFDWTAPSTPTVTLNVAANAVNNNNNSNGDEWNKTTFNYNLAPSAVNEVENLPIKVFPNPATNLLRVQANGIQSMKVVSMTGSVMQLAVDNYTSNVHTVNINSLASGMYILLIKTNQGTKHTTFVKQ